MRQYGLSKVHRPNPVVQMGLFMDMDGMPLAFNINLGNASEQLTMCPLEQKLNDNFKISKLVVCADAGLSSYGNRKANDAGERVFITVQSLEKLKGHHQEWSLESGEWRMKESDRVFDIGRVQDRCPDHHKTNDEKNNIIHKEKRQEIIGHMLQNVIIRDG